MKPSSTRRDVSSVSTSPETPWLFVIVLFGVAIAVGVVVTILGINGMIGGPIP
jgi:hypothetical protein